MKKVICVLLVFAVSPFLTGCASIIHGGAQDVPISSTPDGASVTIQDDNQTILSGETPFTANLERGDGFFRRGEYTVEINKPGYEKKTVRISGRVSGWYLGGNILFGGALGWIIIDPATGAMWTLNPAEIRTNLSEKQAEKLEEDLDKNRGILVVLDKERLEKLKPALRPMQSVRAN